LGKKSLVGLNIPKESLPAELIEKSNNISSQRKSKIEENYSSVFDFIAIIYHLRFIEKLQISEIANTIGMQVEPLHIQLYNLRWHYSNDYKQNNIAYQMERELLLRLCEEAKNNIIYLNLIEHPILKQSNTKVRDIRESTYVGMGFISAEEYIKTLYYLIFINELTTVQLSILFDWTFTTTHYRIKKLGFNLNHTDGIAKKTKKKRHNYEKSIRAGKITRLRDQIKNASTGTKNENYARALLANMAYDYFDSNIYDVVVGVNNTGILSAKEVDIPIMIYDRKKDKLFKFSVEYNGEIYHKEDEDKKNIAKSRGWIYIAIPELQNKRASNNLELIKQKVIQICEIMKHTIGFC